MELRLAGVVAVALLVLGPAQAALEPIKTSAIFGGQMFPVKGHVRAFAHI